MISYKKVIARATTKCWNFLEIIVIVAITSVGPINVKAKTHIQICARRLRAWKTCGSNIAKIIHHCCFYCIHTMGRGTKAYFVMVAKCAKARVFSTYISCKIPEKRSDRWQLWTNFWRGLFSPCFILQGGGSSENTVISLDTSKKQTQICRRNQGSEFAVQSPNVKRDIVIADKKKNNHKIVALTMGFRWLGSFK